jgi:exodeoxyribonuclease VII small subunit
MSDPQPADELSFEDAMSELEQLVLQLERGEGSLEQSIGAFERGMSLARRCEQRLDEADAKVALLLGEADAVRAVDLRTGEPLPEQD